MSYSCETNAILPHVQLLIGIGFGPVRFECHENVDILDIRPPRKRRSRLRTRARCILRLQTLLDNHGFRAVTMIISAGKLIWLLGKNSRTASSTSDATLAVCAAVSLANFSLRLSDISERISQNFSREIGASIRNLKRRSRTSPAPASSRIWARAPGSAKRNAPG